MDFFDFFRYVLATVVTIYASLMTAQSAMGWYQWLQQPDRQIEILRRYIVVAALRLRFARFWADAVVCVMLCIAFIVIWHAHGVVNEVGIALADAHRKLHPPHWRDR